VEVAEISRKRALKKLNKMGRGEIKKAKSRAKEF
jgi:hypothetical protein